MSNLFCQEGQLLYTPSLQRCGVAGVVRALILEIAKEQGAHIETGDFMLQDILQADALYLTSSLAGLRSVSRITGYDWHARTADAHPLLKEAARRVFD